MKSMVYIPKELMDKIYGYLPIITNEQYIVNTSILAIYSMKKLIKAFAIYFNTEQNSEPSEAILACATGWIYNDLILYFNDNTPVNRNFSPSLVEFFSRFSQEKITSNHDLGKYESNFATSKDIIMKCACYMTIDELESFYIYCDEIYNLSSVIDDWESL